MAVSNPPTFGAITNPAPGSVRAEFAQLGSSTSLYAYRRGGPIIPDTTDYAQIGYGTVASPLKLSQFAGLSIPSVSFLGSFYGVSETKNISNGATTTDSSGNIFYTIDVAGNGLEVYKTTSSGNVLWQRTLVPTEPVGDGTLPPFLYIYSLDTDSSGNLYCMGEISFKISGTGTQTYNHKLFLCKFNSSGTLLWQKTIVRPPYYSGGSDVSYGIAATDGKIDPTNSYIYMCGKDYIGAFPPGNQGFLAKFDLNGNLIWIVTNSANDNADSFGSITFDSSGNIILGGTSPASVGSYITKFNSSGTCLWSKYYAGPVSGSNIPSIAALGSYYYAAIPLAVDNNQGTLHIVKIDPSTGNAISLIRSGNALGSPSGAVSIYRGTSCSTDGSHIYITDFTTTCNFYKFDADLNLIWQRTLSPSGAITYGNKLEFRNNRFHFTTTVSTISYSGPSTGTTYVGKLNVDGSGTGIYGSYNYNYGSAYFVSPPPLSSGNLSTAVVSQPWTVTNGAAALGTNSTALSVTSF